MKMSSRFFASAACLGLTLLGVSATRAQTVNPVPAPTIITTAPYTITAAGYYQLGANLTYTGTGQSFLGIVEIQANNVTLDLAGHYISGSPGSTGSTVLGVHANGYENISVINGTIANVYEGVKFEGTNSNQLLQNLLITHCYGFGVFLVGSVGVDVLNCRVNTIGGSTEVSNAWGLDLGSGTGVRVSNCVVTDVTAASGGTAYGITGSSTTFERGNNISNCTTGISGGKYQDNLTSGCTTTVTGGTDAGGNN